MLQNYSGKSNSACFPATLCCLFHTWCFRFIKSVVKTSYEAMCCLLCKVLLFLLKVANLTLQVNLSLMNGKYTGSKNQRADYLQLKRKGKARQMWCRTRKRSMKVTAAFYRLYSVHSRNNSLDCWTKLYLYFHIYHTAASASVSSVQKRRHQNYLN